MKVPTGFSSAGERGIADIYKSVPLTILCLMKHGWEKAVAKSTVNSDLEEVKITARFREGMIEVLKDGLFHLGREILVARGTETSSHKDPYRATGLSDIAIYFTGIREKLDDHEPQAIVECKRISAKGSDLARLYVVEGINRFRDGKYAGDLPYGFMVGYLLCGDVDSAVRLINHHLENRGRTSEGLATSSLIEEAWARYSRHPRPEIGRDIHCHHAFLGFRKMCS